MYFISYHAEELVSQKKKTIFKLEMKEFIKLLQAARITFKAILNLQILFGTEFQKRRNSTTNSSLLV